ncbi:MAG: hypothetical protein R8N24_00765 [Alphaproteobacteria bacterium]|jgi:hypothetical protein|nr:hypothetical protein [Alphaproteobacteria bacterium]
MKKTLIALLGFVLVAGCSSYEYYRGGVRYVQDDSDCIFTSVEQGNRYSDEIRTLDIDKEIVYRNTKCRDLYFRDNMNQVSRTERQVLKPVEKKNFDCAKKAVKTYVFVK